MENNAKKETQREWGTEELYPERQRPGQGGIQEASQGDWNQCIGASGQVGFGRNFPQIACLLGGVISQLLESEEQRLKETEECISWYQREHEKVRQRVNNLKQLKQLAEAELKDSSDNRKEE